jgi:hypothetical protein
MKTIGVMLAIALVSVFVVGTASLAAKGAKGGALDGTKWQVTLDVKGQKPMPDTLGFEKGRFDSVACHPMGFGNGAYKAKQAKNAWTFAASTKSPKKGTMLWKGKVEGDKISGTLDWKNEKGKMMKATYSGNKAA